MSPTATSFEEALQRFGLHQFRSGQREVIEAIVAGHDCLCVMPTGGGKSLCYQLPSLIRQGLTIVVSPLIALMKDQVDGLRRHGIPATLINSSLSHAEQQERLQAVASGRVQLVYVAPERLRNQRFLDAIRATPIQLLAIDEAHCISQWGHDFRPDYARLGRFREWLGGIQTVALTATATPRVREDIVEVLRLKKPKQFMSGFARPNLHFGVVSTQNDREKEEELEGFLRRTQGSGIIYSATRKRCDALVEMISNKLKRSVGAYHAGLLPEQRKAIQERFMRGELEIVVATNAFGMGIDKSDLRFVIHYNLTGSLEAYYQEAGRAGRDGLQSQCVMLYSFQDRYIQEFFIDNNYPDRSVIQAVYEFMQQRPEDPIELTLEEIRDALGLSISPEAVGSSLHVLARTRVLERLDRGSGLAMVRLDSNLPSLVDQLPREAKVQRQVLRTLERIVGDRRREYVAIHPQKLLNDCGLQRDALTRALRQLSRLDDIDYIPPFRGKAVHFLRHDIPFDELGIDFENLKRRKDAEYDRLNQVVKFTQTPRCRQVTILDYFGDPDSADCGHCDRCLRQPGWPKLDSHGVENPSAAQQAKTNVERDSASGNIERSHVSGGRSAANQSARMVDCLREVTAAIEQIHSRLGKILLAQYLCGSQNAKIQKLRLHRLGGFGLLNKLRQSDGVQLLEAMLAAGVLQQQEVSRHRPTIGLASDLQQATDRDTLLNGVHLPPDLRRRLLAAMPTPAPTSKSRVPPSDQGRNANSGATEKAAAQPLASWDEANAALRASTAPAGTSTTPKVSTIVGGKDTPSRTSERHDRGASARLDRKALSELTQPSVTDSSTATLQAESAEMTPAESVEPDWRWTMRLFEAGYRWPEVAAIRRMGDQEVASSLCLAMREGAVIKRSWLSATGDDLRSAGQQLVLRELQRRAAAGIG